MRALVLTAFVCCLAGCGEAPAEKKTERAAAIAPGQWELASEVTGFRQTDTGRPSIATPVGTRATASVCVGAGSELPTAYFAGEGYRCAYGTGSYYVRGGRINLTMTCTREGLTGNIAMSVEGTFQSGSAEFRRNLRTILVSDGDVEIDSRVTGRRTGDCTPDAGGSEGGNKQG